MRPISCLLVSLLLVPSARCQQMAGDHDDDPRVLADLGANTTLSCASPGPWFFCVWEGPGGGRVCGLRDRLGDTSHEALCGGDSRTMISGETQDDVWSPFTPASLSLSLVISPNCNAFCCNVERCT